MEKETFSFFSFPIPHPEFRIPPSLNFLLDSRCLLKIYFSILFDEFDLFWFEGEKRWDC